MVVPPPPPRAGSRGPASEAAESRRASHSRGPASAAAERRCVPVPRSGVGGGDQHRAVRRHGDLHRKKAHIQDGRDLVVGTGCGSYRELRCWSGQQRHCPRASIRGAPSAPLLILGATIDDLRDGQRLGPDPSVPEFSDQVFLGKGTSVRRHRSRRSDSVAVGQPGPGSSARVPRSIFAHLRGLRSPDLSLPRPFTAGSFEIRSMRP